MYKKILIVISLSFLFMHASEDGLSYYSSDFSNEFEFESFRAIGAHLSFDIDSSEASTTPKISCDIKRIFFEQDLHLSVTMDNILGNVDKQLKRLNSLDKKLQQLKKNTDLKQLQKSNLDKKNK